MTRPGTQPRPGPYGITCPECAADPDVPCTNPVTGRHYRYNMPHIRRVRAAQKTARI